jgi:hypothetical protein
MESIEQDLITELEEITNRIQKLADSILYRPILNKVSAGVPFFHAVGELRKVIEKIEESK